MIITFEIEQIILTALGIISAAFLLGWIKTLRGSSSRDTTLQKRQSIELIPDEKRKALQALIQQKNNRREGLNV